MLDCGLRRNDGPSLHLVTAAQAGMVIDGGTRRIGTMQVPTLPSLHSGEAVMPDFGSATVLANARGGEATQSVMAERDPLDDYLRQAQGFIDSVDLE